MSDQWYDKWDWKRRPQIEGRLINVKPADKQVAYMIEEKDRSKTTIFSRNAHMRRNFKPEFGQMYRFEHDGKSERGYETFSFYRRVTWQDWRGNRHPYWLPVYGRPPQPYKPKEQEHVVIQGFVTGLERVPLFNIDVFHLQAADVVGSTLALGTRWAVDTSIAAFQEHAEKLTSLRLPPLREGYWLKFECFNAATKPMQFQIKELPCEFIDL